MAKPISQVTALSGRDSAIPAMPSTASACMTTPVTMARRRENRGHSHTDNNWNSAPASCGAAINQPICARLARRETANAPR